MYMSEISKSKVSGLKAKKIVILWTLKHVSAKSEHPLYLTVLTLPKVFIFRISHIHCPVFDFFYLMSKHVDLQSCPQ